MNSILDLLATETPLAAQQQVPIIVCKDVLPKEKDMKDSGKIKVPRVCEVCDRTENWLPGVQPVCESCASFFHRNCYLEFPPCQKNCKIELGSRKSCKPCRLRKCLEKGMTVSSSPVPNEDNQMISGVDVEKHPSHSDLIFSDEPGPATPGVPINRMMNPNISNHLDDIPVKANLRSWIRKEGQCKVCQATIDPSYPVCGVCMIFYSDSLKETLEEYKCINNDGSCKINKYTRDQCKFCWLEKCKKTTLSVHRPEVHQYITGKRQRTQKVCKVCDRVVSRFYEGHPVCDNCGRFFRRHCHSNIPRPCQNNCKIVIGSSEFCKSCRLRKCFESGMTVYRRPVLPSNLDRSPIDDARPATPEVPSSGMMNLNISNCLDAPSDEEGNNDAMSDHDILEPSVAPGHSDEAKGTSSLTHTASTFGQPPKLVSSVISEVSDNISSRSDESGNEDVDYAAISDNDISEPYAAHRYSDESGDELMLEAAPLNNSTAPVTNQFPKLLSAVIPTFSDESDDELMLEAAPLSSESPRLNPSVNPKICLNISKHYDEEKSRDDAMPDDEILEPSATPGHSDEIVGASSLLQSAPVSDTQKVSLIISSHPGGSGKHNYDVPGSSTVPKSSEEVNNVDALDAASTSQGLLVAEFTKQYKSKDLAGKQNILKATMAILARDAFEKFGNHCKYHDFHKKTEKLEIKSFHYNADDDYFKNFEQLAGHYFGDFMKNIEDMVSFFMIAPGFEDLPKDDVKFLIKQNLHVLHFLWSLPGFTGSEFILSDGTKLSKTELQKIFTSEFFEDVPDFEEFCREELKMNEKQRMLLILYTASQSNLPEYKHKFSDETSKMIEQNYEGYEKMLMYMPGDGTYEQDVLQDILGNFNEFNRQMDKMMNRYRKHRDHFVFPESFNFYFGQEE